ncbi:MAG TPA: hypothetical protein VGA16_06320 [Candidatus Limnocylindria bacterium]
MAALPRLDLVQFGSLATAITAAVALALFSAPEVAPSPAPITAIARPSEPRDVEPFAGGITAPPIVATIPLPPTPAPVAALPATPAPAPVARIAIPLSPPVVVVLPPPPAPRPPAVTVLPPVPVSPPSTPTTAGAVVASVVPPTAAAPGAAAPAGPTKAPVLLPPGKAVGLANRSNEKEPGAPSADRRPEKALGLIRK